MLGRQRVLVVEDDEDLRDALQGALEQAGFEATGAANGRDALEQLAVEHLPDLILLDLWMPVMDGFEFRQRQRANPALAEIPTIVLSGESAPPVGAAPVLMKPFDLQQLVAMASELCQRRTT